MQQEQRIPVSRFLSRLDACLNRNDRNGARECLVFWEAEARRLGDDRGLLTVLNEAVGYYRRTQKRQRALEATEECLRLTEKLCQERSASGATIFTNAATTFAFFGYPERAFELYEKAADCFAATGQTESYAYAALLNNRAAVFHAQKQFDEAEADWRRAVAILQQVGYHDGEIAVSLIMLAHLTYDRDETAIEQVEALLDEAWDYINSENQPKDGTYADVLRKCAPSLDYFHRPDEAQACRDVAKEIYTGNAE